jgi:acetyltransferase-like isoleucine patch superfamily enzyme
MKRYIYGFLKNLFNPAVHSFSSLIDNVSNISKKARIGRQVQIVKTNIGDYSYISSRSEVVNANIGKFCSIARDCSIGLASHSLNFLSTSPIFTARNNALKKVWADKNYFTASHQVNIGNDVWIGKNVKIIGGVSIGDGAVIGTGAVVTKDIPPYAIAVGVPAKVIKYRFDSHIIEKLLQIQWWNLSEKELKTNIHLFQINHTSLDNLDIFQKIII